MPLDFLTGSNIEAPSPNVFDLTSSQDDPTNDSLQEVVSPTFENLALKEFVSPLNHLKFLKLRLWTLLSKFLPRNWVKALSKILINAKLVREISPEYINRLSSQWISKISSKQLKGMSVDEFVALDVNQLKAIPLKRLKKIDFQQIQALDSFKKHSLGDDWMLEAKQQRLQKLENEISQLDSKEMTDYLIDHAMEIEDLLVDHDFDPPEWLSPLIEAFIAEKWDLPEETIEINRESIQKMIGKPKDYWLWLDEHDQRCDGIELDGKLHQSGDQFGKDVSRSRNDQWIINGTTMPDDVRGRKMIESVILALYSAFDHNIALLDNFEKIAHQGLTADPLLLCLTRYCAFPALNAFFYMHVVDGFKVIVDTSDTTVRLEVAMEWLLHFSPSRKGQAYGTVASSFVMKAEKEDFAKGDLSNSDMYCRIGQLSPC